jgi:plastocyanin
MTDENTSSESSVSTASSGSTVQKNKMNPMMIVVAIAVIAVIAAVVMFMKGGTGKSDEESTSQANQTTQSVDESKQGVVTNNGNAVIVKMEAGNFYFKPNVIRAKIGQTVKVELAAVSMQHDFVIDKLGVKSALVPSGQSTTIEFIADTLGEFEFYCSVGDHRQQGMVGTLIVEQ